jgi:hypothetical protein
MNPRLSLSLVAAFALVAPLAFAAEFKFGDATITVPDGYTVERIAAAPLVDRPISAAFDEQGRMYATDSAGMTEKAEKQLAAKPHRIRRLVDSNGDGVFDQSTLFADKVMFPEGCLWHEGSLYVAAPRPPETAPRPRLADAAGHGLRADETGTRRRGGVPENRAEVIPLRGDECDFARQRIRKVSWC